MKKKKILSLSYDLFFCLLVFGMTAPVYGQQLMRFQFDEFQEVNFATSASAQEINLPSKAFVLKIQNLNSLLIWETVLMYMAICCLLKTGQPHQTDGYA